MYCLEKKLCPLAPAVHGCSANIHECGATLVHNATVWSSPDLRAWTYRADMVPIVTRPNPGPYYRPAVLVSPSNATVLWFHYHAGHECNMLVSSGSSPVGPFSIVSNNTPLVYATGDHSLFQDDDADRTAYLVYRSQNRTTGRDAGISVERLAPDYLSSLGPADPARHSSGPISPPGFEAPAMFKRRGVYYVIAGGQCCECAYGSSSLLVYTSRAPLGPYTLQGDVGNGDDGTPVTHAQQVGVLQIPGVPDPPFVWVGDRWQHAPDGLHGHDPTYMAPLAFDDTQSPPALQRFVWTDGFNFTLA